MNSPIINNDAQTLAVSTLLPAEKEEEEQCVLIIEDEEEEEEGEIVEQEIFEVKFHSKNDFDKLSTQIVDALEAKLSQGTDKYTFTVLAEQLYIKAFLVSEKTINDDNSTPATEPALLAVDGCAERPEEPAATDADDLSAFFMIDTEPTKRLDIAKVPSYKRVTKDVLAEAKEGSDESKDNAQKCPRPGRSAGTCFNCGSNEHELRMCPKVRNLARINRAKKSFASKQERYHADVEQRFAHLRPGIISDDLRNALNLQRGELPFFYYRMRLLGYPPGWLEEAKVEHSGMQLFNSTDSHNSEESTRDGRKPIKYDISKIIDYPGFNVDPGATFYDDYKHHDVPALNAAQMKTEFIKTLGEDNCIQGYKRRKLNHLPGTAMPADAKTANASVEVVDMDLEDDPADCSIVTDKFFSKSTSSPPSPRGFSPTLLDLMTQQRDLLLALEDVATNPPESVKVFTINSSADIDSNETLSTDNSITTTTTSATATMTTPSTPATSHNAADLIKSSHMGTPILKFSPYDKLPDGNNFKAGVSDVINFENLPDSTGKYEQMKVVIKKVRNIVTQLANDSD